MFQKGISVYTGLQDYSLEQNIWYIQNAALAGYECIFSSAHINEASSALSDLQTIIDEGNKYGMRLTLDVSKPMMESFQIPENLYALRLDWGFSDEEVVELSKKASCMIELNASTISAEKLQRYVDLGLKLKKVRASFNFYPKKHTGHCIEDCQKKIAMFHAYHIPVLIFLPSTLGKRPPLYEGLPSVESHRIMDLDLAIEELKAIGADEIAFGDAYASMEELTILKKHQTEEYQVSLSVLDGCPNNMLNHLAGIFRVRPDQNDEMLRVTSKRGQTLWEPFHTVDRQRGTVTIDNQGFLRYSGEICLNLQELEADNRVNVIGYYHMTDMVLGEIKLGKPFCFTIKEGKRI